MYKNNNLLFAIHSFSIVIFLLLNKLFLSLPEMEHPVLYFFLTLLAEIISYSIIYNLVKLFFQKVIWKYKYKPYNLHGKWYHVHIIDQKDDYLRYGDVHITQEFYHIDIKGHNTNIEYDPESGTISPINAQKTNWQEQNCYITASNTIVGCYQAHRIFHNESIRHGIHKFEIPGDNEWPDRISGTFQDASPYKRSGVIELFRKKADRDAFIKTICDQRTAKERYLSAVSD